MSEPLEYRVEDGVATLTLARPEKRNAMTFAMLREFHALVARAGVLASANDLAAAAAVVAGGLVPFRRALLRLLGRPIGLSGSGPTLWALYPSVADAAAAATIVNEAIDDGNLPGGDGRRPFVTATSIASGSADGGTDGAGEGRST